MSFFSRAVPNLPDYFYNQTITWSGSDTFENYKKYQPNPYTTDNVSYSLNEYGFRSDPFIFNDIRMVFLGCSYTLGAGLPLEETFSYIIYNEIKKKIGREFPYWNLAMGGSGLDSITRCYYNFQDLLKPQVVISLFPEYRIEYFVSENQYKSALVSFNPDQIFSKNPFLIKPNVITYSIQKNLAMLDLLFEKNQTLSIWDTWAYDNFKNLDFSNLQNFKNHVNLWKTIDSNTVLTPRARDGLHAGKVHNFLFAKSILDKYGDMICEQLTR